MARLPPSCLAGLRALCGAGLWKAQRASLLRAVRLEGRLSLLVGFPLSARLPCSFALSSSLSSRPLPASVSPVSPGLFAEPAFASLSSRLCSTSSSPAAPPAEKSKAADGDFLALVKKLRALTGGVSIGECRKALEASNMDLDEAAVYLRKRGVARAAKAADRVAAEGLIAVAALPVSEETLSPAGDGQTGTVVCLLELNSETDFVSKSPRFIALARAAARAAATAASRTSVCGTGAAQAGVTGDRQAAAGQADAKALSAFVIEAAKASFVDPEDFREAGLGEAFLQQGRRDEGDTCGASPSPCAAASGGAAGQQNTLEDVMVLLTQQFGEKLQISRVENVSVSSSAASASLSCCPPGSPSFPEEAAGWYVHGQVAEGVGRAAAVVVLDWRQKRDVESGAALEAACAKGKRAAVAALARLIAMQAVATRPRYVRLSDISEAEIENERSILRASVAHQFSSAASAPPEKMEKAVEGRLQAQLKEQTLLEQDFLLASQMETDVLRKNDSGEAGGTAAPQKEKKADNQTSSVKEALRRAAKSLGCEDLDIKDMRLLGIGLS
ncbi:elongation factor TS protein [Besnoitia besnoiti]|uniref:Elongation factor Ts, mitochondrial n=1 Tax=Besnoitia besnoiti TaxID=94643 RepID=A0A2A9M1H7_BESBE|nr:elongation factor TS protein [Besnoitia besnoiti]PFH31829.1 elongation factor TS protein [Besnoitia besnoiti]